MFQRACSPSVAHKNNNPFRLTAIELHPQDHFALKTRFAGVFQVRVLQLDGWLAKDVVEELPRTNDRLKVA